MSEKLCYVHEHKHSCTNFHAPKGTRNLNLCHSIKTLLNSIKQVFFAFIRAGCTILFFSTYSEVLSEESELERSVLEFPSLLTATLSLLRSRLKSIGNE